ncbi:M48 family metalloprotease [Roseibium salinum]|nr:M48 family metalloprotease [Roseibium salinum]
MPRLVSAPALPDRQSGARLVRKAVALACSAAIALPMAITPAHAQSRNLPVVRDAEAESLLKDYATPIFKAAGIAHSEPEIILVNDKSFNAFVPDSRRMFINIGVLLEAETPGEVIGVIAHETGHIAGRHLVRLRSAAANAQIVAVIGMILGAGAAAAGAATGSGQAASGGAAAILGSGSVGQRSLLAYQRGEEAAADRAALKYLEATGQSPPRHAQDVRAHGRAAVLHPPVCRPVRPEPSDGTGALQRPSE